MIDTVPALWFRLQRAAYCPDCEAVFEVSSELSVERKEACPACAGGSWMLVETMLRWPKERGDG